MKFFLKTKFTVSLLCSAIVITSTLSFAQSIGEFPRFEPMAQFTIELGKTEQRQGLRYRSADNKNLAFDKQDPNAYPRLTDKQRVLLSGKLKFRGLLFPVSSISGVANFGNAKPTATWLTWAKGGGGTKTLYWWTPAVDSQQIAVVDTLFGALKQDYVSGSVFKGALPGIYIIEDTLKHYRSWDFTNGVLYDPVAAGFYQFGVDPLYGISVNIGQEKVIYDNIQALNPRIKSWLVIYLASNLSVPHSWPALQAQGYKPRIGDRIAVDLRNIDIGSSKE